MNTKRCYDCGKTKPRAEFYNNASKADGLADQCSKCHREENRKRREAHPEIHREQCHRYREANLEECREQDREYSRRYRAENLTDIAAATARRRALRLKQTPKWCAPGTVAYDFIGELYSDAKHFSEVFGVEYQVEHKCPLARGGSHEPGNMTIIPATLNMQKGAKLDYEFPPNVFHKVTWRSWSRQRAR